MSILAYCAKNNEADLSGKCNESYSERTMGSDTLYEFDTIENQDYIKNLIRELISLPSETEWVEFKHNNYEPQMIVHIKL